MDDEKAVREAVDQWFVALNAMLNGNPEPFAEVYSHADDVSYLSAEGTYCVGWEATYADWRLQAEKALGGRAEGTDVHVIVCGDMAAAQHRNKASVTGADGQTVDVAMRESSVFRKEGGQWKIVSHHADDMSLWEGVVKK